MNINSDKLVNSSEFVREPIDSVFKEINNELSSRIIINGGRGIGKSVLLSSIENRTISTESPYISARFDAIGLGVENDEYFDDNFFTHYYEVLLCNKLLNYIRNNYGVYRKQFLDYENKVRVLLNNTYDYINEVYYGKCKLNRYLSSGELSLEILDKIKEVLGLDKVNLIIDNFDKINNSSEIAQQNISGYFDNFNKVILAVSDENINEDNLINKGYSFISLDYSKDLEVIKEIIRRRVVFYTKNKTRYVSLDVDLFTNRVCEKLISETNGDLRIMLEVVWKLCDYYQYEYFDFNKYLNRIINEQIDSYNHMKKKVIKPKLYL